MKIVTPHISADTNDFAKTVLMPGDPLRAKFIAETYLESPKLINDIRGMLAYTGYYKGTKVTVMASGMGAPSMGIYSYELYSKFGVENIIRIGSAGAISSDLNLRDIVVGMGVCTDSNYAAQYNLPGTYSPICDYSLLKITDTVAKEMNIPINIGNIYSQDAFYNVDKSCLEKWSSMGVLAVEMEATALYLNAAYLKKKALTICTISDNIIKNEHCTPEERQTSFNSMVELSLNVVIRLDGKEF